MTPRSRQLPLFESHPVQAKAVSLTGTVEQPGTDVEALALGEEVSFVVRAKVVEVDHKGDPENAALVRVEKAKVIECYILADASVFADVKDAADERRDQVLGRTKLPVAS